MALENHCKRKKLDNFELYLRLSQENLNPSKWDETFIKDELANYKEIKRVWVCGPPAMSETFDRLAGKLIDEDIQFEIL